MTTNYDAIKTKIERMIEQRKAEHLERIARFELDPACTCSWCGDTGMSRETGGICDCDAGDLVRIEAERAATWSAAVPDRFAGYRLEACPNAELAAAVADWLHADPVTSGCNLVIQGPVGVGKTGAAIGALRDLHMAGKSIGYWSLPNLMDVFRQEERSSKTGRDYVGNRAVPVMERITALDCLLLDDLGQERPTEYVAERLYVLIDGRYVVRKPTIITTNLSGQNLATHMGERSASRIRENYVSIPAAGPDYRASNGNGRVSVLVRNA